MFFFHFLYKYSSYVYKYFVLQIALNGFWFPFMTIFNNTVGHVVFVHVCVFVLFF